MENIMENEALWTEILNHKYGNPELNFFIKQKKKEEVKSQCVEENSKP